MTEAYNMDCMDYMRSLPDKAFDLAVVDPPYGIGADMFNNGSGASKDKRIYGTAKRIRKNRLNSGGGKLRNRKLNTSDCSWDSAPPSEDYFSELFRVTKNQVIWGGNYFSLGPCREILVWDKKQPWENFSQVEFTWTSFDGPAAIFRMCNTMGGKIHPTQKPVELYAWVYNRFAKPGDRILDTHLGSGSSRIAAYDAGLDFVGCEIDETYFKLQEQRFERHSAQLNLFLEEDKL
jgi:site-specific DNA-methyltransferase (adenine-specific)